MSLDDLDVTRLLERTGEKWRAYPDDVLALWVADMDFELAPPLRELLRRTLEYSDTGYGLAIARDGLPSLFAARVLERFDWSIDPARVEVLTDVVQGLYLGLYLLCPAGEGAVFQPPIYPPFLECVEEVGRRSVPNELLRGAERYEIDFDALGASDARVLMLCNPHNPTGRVFTRAELEQIASIALERDWIVLSDEIHADLVLPGHTHVPIASLGPEIEERTITLMSATKAFNIAGLRCALAHFGSEELHHSFNILPRHIRGGLGSLGLSATEIAWTRCQPWLDEVVRYLDENRRFVEQAVRSQLPGVEMRSPEGTYLAWLDCRALELEPGPYRFFLEQARVALSDGARFGPGGAGFVRLNFATSREIVTQAIERMARAVKSRGA